MRKISELYCRFDPNANLDQLTKAGNVRVWVHGGKFKVGACANLIEANHKLGRKSVLDIGQKTRNTQIMNAVDFGNHEYGAKVFIGSRICLSVSELSDQDVQPDVTIISANWLPKISEIKQKETGIVFGDGDKMTRTKIDWNKSTDDELALTVVETANGKIFTNEAFGGETTFFPETRPNLLSPKDFELLKAIDSSLVDRLVVSFVRKSADIAELNEALDKFWPGWKDRKGNKIIFKLETRGAYDNLPYFLALDNCDYMLGLGDLENAVGKSKFKTCMQSILKQFDDSDKKLIVASGLANSMVGDYEVRELSDTDQNYLNMFLIHPSVSGFGLTFEGVRASQLGLWPDLLKKFSSHF